MTEERKEQRAEEMAIHFARMKADRELALERLAEEEAALAKLRAKSAATAERKG